MSIEEHIADGQSRPALSISKMSKRFGGTRALHEVSFDVHDGEVLALLGHNGSGKSTVIKILAGFHQPDGGTAELRGSELTLGDAQSANSLGLRFVHQDLGIVEELNAVDNVALTSGYLRGKFGTVDQGRQAKRTTELLERFDIEIDVSAPLSEADPVQRTGVAIARALWDWEEGESRVLVLDEPTAALPSREVSQLFDLINRVRDAGHAVVYVSHRMDEIQQIADRVIVLRAGEVVADTPVTNAKAVDLARLITDNEQHTVAAGRDARSAAGEPVLSVRGLSGHHTHDVDITLHAGEIVGVAGLQGSGREEIAYLLGGAHSSKASGGWQIAGQTIAPPTSASAHRAGIALVPGERLREGLIANFTVSENLTLARLERISKPGRLASKRTETEFARRWMRALEIAEHVADDPILTLSGGNQQKVLLARWLCTEPRVLLLTEPTAGVDIGARRALYELLKEQAAAGLAILVCSSDVEDLVELCDRVLVMREGVIASTAEGTQINAPHLLTQMESSHV